MNLSRLNGRTVFAGGMEWSTRLIAELAGRKTRSRSTLLLLKAKTQADLRKYVSISRYTKCRKCLKQQDIPAYKDF